MKKKENNRLNIEVINKEHDRYSVWKDVSVNLNGNIMTFGIQKYISSVEIDRIIEAYGKYLQEFSDLIIPEIKDINNNEDSEKVLIGMLLHLWAFVVRFKTDIFEGKKIVEKIDNNKMFQLCVKLVELNCFDEILEKFDSNSLDKLRDKFFGTLQISLAAISKDLTIGELNVKNLKKIAEEVKKDLKGKDSN